MAGRSKTAAAGELESAILHGLWSVDEPLTPRQVLGMLDRDLAYTTVMTTLVRLHAKGLVERKKDGRAFAYRPTTDDAGFHADRMCEPLHNAADLDAVLLRFVGTLTSEERERLQSALDEGPVAG